MVVFILFLIISTAAVAHFTFPLVHFSGSSFLLGVYEVGQNVFFNAREVKVRADEDGMDVRYGSGS